MSQVQINYEPHGRQLAIHLDPTRFKVVAAGRRGGKTVLLVNEHIKQALTHPQLPGLPVQRSWYVCQTYRQAETIAWRMCLNYLPPDLIKAKNNNKLTIELTNGHIMEFKGAQEKDDLRGVGLVWVGIDEYGNMSPEVWTEIIRPMLVESQGGAMFIGTPGADGSPHFHDLFLLGQGQDPAYKSWLFFTKDNPYIPPEEVEEARRTTPPDIFKREFEADFTVTAGLIYDNFRRTTHCIPNYEPTADDFVVGSIDPGLNNPTAALLCAWDKNGVGRIFKEYYQSNKLAHENAMAIKKMSDPYKVSYWIIDRASTHRDQISGMTVFAKYQEFIKPLLTGANDPNTVWAGIDEVKKLFHVDPSLGTPRLFISVHCNNTLWEIGRYIRYRRKWHIEKNQEEKPRKLDDHAMDCMRNMVVSRPWMRRGIRYVERRVPHGGY